MNEKILLETEWLIGRPVDWMTDWQTDYQLTGWLIEWLEFTTEHLGEHIRFKVTGYREDIFDLQQQHS